MRFLLRGGRGDLEVHMGVSEIRGTLLGSFFIRESYKLPVFSYTHMYNSKRQSPKVPNQKPQTLKALSAKPLNPKPRNTLNPEP